MGTMSRKKENTTTAGRSSIVRSKISSFSTMDRGTERTKSHDVAWQKALSDVWESQKCLLAKVLAAAHQLAKEQTCRIALLIRGPVILDTVWLPFQEAVVALLAHWGESFLPSQDLAHGSHAWRRCDLGSVEEEWQERQLGSKPINKSSDGPGKAEHKKKPSRSVGFRPQLGL